MVTLPWPSLDHWPTASLHRDLQEEAHDSHLAQGEAKATFRSPPGHFGMKEWTEVPGREVLGGGSVLTRAKPGSRCHVGVGAAPGTADLYRDRSPCAQRPERPAAALRAAVPARQDPTPAPCPEACAGQSQPTLGPSEPRAGQRPAPTPRARNLTLHLVCR